MTNLQKQTDWFIKCSTTQKKFTPMPTDPKNSFDFTKESYLHPFSGERKISIKPSYFTSFVKYGRRPKIAVPAFSISMDGTEHRQTCITCGKVLNIDEFANKQENCNSCLNLSDNKQNGDISEKSKSRLLLAFDWLYNLSLTKKAYNEKYKKWYAFKIALLTVKLPCAQLIHEWDPRPAAEKKTVDKTTGEIISIPNPLSPQAQSDLYIKHYILNELLTILRKKYEINLYIWRAEKGDDHILHFHILHDHFINHQEINKIWNKIISKHGYIDQYRKNQQEFHKDGFHYRPEKDCSINKKTGKPQRPWSKSEQIKAYKKGIATNWSCPTGDTDIHSIRSIKNTRAYIAKYICKESDVKNKLATEIEKYKHQLSVDSVPKDIEEKIKQQIITDFGIAGNLWYISQPLSRLKSAISDASEMFITLFQTIQDTFPNRIYYAEWSQIFHFTLKDIIAKKFTPLIDSLREFVAYVRSKYYPVENNLFSSLGIPLTLFS